MPAITVKGMHCEFCAKAVANAIGALPGVAGVVVDWQNEQASWEDAHPAAPVLCERVKQAVGAVGFDAP